MSIFQPEHGQTHLGELQTRLAGMERLRGDIRPGDPVLLERDPFNPRDPNAVAVLNPLGEPVGFLPRAVSFWLSPLLDRGAVWLEGNVPQFRGDGEEKRRWPLSISVYLTAAGSDILRPRPAPASEAEAFHEMVRALFSSVEAGADPAAARSACERLRRSAGRAMLPETHLLLALMDAGGDRVRDRDARGTLDAIRARLDGMRPAEPVQVLNLTVFPIRAGNNGRARYETLPAAIKNGTAEAGEISEDGSVPELMLRNRGALPILLPEGEILCGAKQNRVVNMSLMAPPGETRVPVSCVERGRWRMDSRHFNPEFYAHPGLRAKKVRSVTQNLRNNGVARSDQGEVWNEVDMSLASMRAFSPTDSMTDGYRGYEDKIAAYREAARLPEDTIGVVVCGGGEAIGMDCFDSPETFREYWPRISDAYFAQAAWNPRMGGETPPAAAAEFIRSLGPGVRLCDPPIGAGRPFFVERPGAAGTGVWHEDRLCHISAFPAGDDTGPARRGFPGYPAAE